MILTEKQHAPTPNEQPLTHCGKKTVLGWITDATDDEHMSSSTPRCSRNSKEHYIMKRGKVISISEHSGRSFLESHPGEAVVQPVESGGGHGEEPSQDWELFDGACDIMITQGAARRARGILIPPGPSLAEHREHVLTHLPSRAWCPSCVSGRGKEHPHAQGGKDPASAWPLVPADYACMHTAGDKGDRTVIDITTGATVATICPERGHDPLAEKVVRHGIESFGRAGDLVLQGDGEYGVLDML